MSYLLGGVEIRRPTSMSVDRSGQYSQHRTLDGSISRDHFGDDKLIFKLEYRNMKPDEYTTLQTLYNDYIDNGTRYFDTTGETVVYGALVHVDLIPREFNIRGTSYISSTTLVLTEA